MNRGHTYLQYSIGGKMYSDSTLKSCTKDELIEFLHVAENNYRNLEDTYECSVSNSNRILHEYEKVFKAAAALLDEATDNGALPCPMEYIGRCTPTLSRNGFKCSSCDFDTDWEYALSEMAKEKAGIK